MNDDTDVLTMLRSAAVEDAPALTLQVDELMRTGRRRRLATRVVSVGAGMALAAGVFAFAVAQDDRGAAPPPGPADRVTEKPSSEYLHMMPALLKAATLPEFGVPTPDWKTFDIAARGNIAGRDPRVPLPEPLWDHASSWELRGATDERGFLLQLTAVAPENANGDPESHCVALRSEGALSCTVAQVGDGRQSVTWWSKDRPGGWFGDARDTSDWFTQSVEVYREGSGYSVAARQGVRAADWAQAKARAWLSDTPLSRIAADPTLDLENVIRYHGNGNPSAVTR